MLSREFIERLYREGLTKAEARSKYEDFLDQIDEKHGDVQVTFSSFERKIRKVYAEQAAIKVEAECYGQDGGDVLTKATDLARQKQCFQDMNRVNVKIAREANRISNVLEKLNEEVLTELPRIKVDVKDIIKIKQSPDALFGILQLSDHHFNELIHSDEIGNAFDFEIGAKRLKKLVDEADRTFKSYGISKIFVAFLGDMINSDRRLDEILHAATNRANATLLACHIYRQMLEDLVMRGYKISVSCVTGNESRAGEFNDFSKIVATDNYDYSIFNFLKVMFEKEKRVTFHSGDWKESLVNISGLNLLLLHGESIRTERDIRDLYSKWANKGIIINFILHGHYHSAMLTDLSARSASLCGANAYSDKQLNLFGKASQNIHVVMKDNSIHSFRFDLQNTGDVKGYQIIKELEEYHAKSSRKLHESVPILTVVI